MGSTQAVEHRTDKRHGDVRPDKVSNWLKVQPRLGALRHPPTQIYRLRQHGYINEAYPCVRRVHAVNSSFHVLVGWTISR